jgi:TPR repeat protein
MQRSVFIGGGRVVVSAYGIAGTKSLPFKGGLENADKSPCDLDETAQRPLIACGRGIDQDPAVNWLPWNTREHVDALLQCAGRVYKLAADQGNATGQTTLGVFYETGRGGLPKDDREAARLYKLAADQGNALAQVSLAAFYETGHQGFKAPWVST